MHRSPTDSEQGQTDEDGPNSSACGRHAGYKAGGNTKRRDIKDDSFSHTQSPSDSRRIAPHGSVGRAESWAGRSNDNRLVGVATERGGPLIRDLAYELVGIRICQRIDISDVADAPRAEPCHDQDLSFGGFPSRLKLTDHKRGPANNRREGAALAAALARKAPFDAAPVMLLKLRNVCAAAGSFPARGPKLIVMRWSPALTSTVMPLCPLHRQPP